MNHEYEQLKPDDCRRDFYRFDDVLPLGYRVVNDVEAGILEAGREPITTRGDLRLRAMLRAINAEARLALGHLETRDPFSARYMKTLERRLELITEALFSLGSESGLDKRQRAVNLSASGLAFTTGTEQVPGTWLELEFDLPSKGAVIQTYARVVRTSAQPGDEEDRFVVAVELRYGDEADQDLVVAYLLESQARSIRMARGGDAVGEG
ncbi:MAG: PilZ domain-containing protein [Gammaproteobacteria bacterium]